jgi:hypothetical protein
MTVREMLDLFNNGELDVDLYFNDYETWFNALKKRNLMSEVDPINASGSEEWQNKFILWLYENDREKYYKILERLLEDIDVDYVNQKVYFVGNRIDLSNLFCDTGRMGLSIETIETILDDAGETLDSWIDYTTEDVYNDVIDELNKENLEYFKNLIIEKLKGKQIDPRTEEMELIAEEQGHPEYFELTIDNVDRIVKDEESMNDLLENELTDLESELHSVHYNAYNSAYETKLYKEVWRKLESYFNGNGEWIEKDHPFKKDTKIQQFKIEISDFEKMINDYLFENRNYGNSGTLEYQGSFINALKEIEGCLTVFPPDYPDYHEISNNINVYFKDYL